jgi:outer membrane protein OmpA-like peptidoglycan-associated protein
MILLQLHKESKMQMSKILPLAIVLVFFVFAVNQSADAQTDRNYFYLQVGFGGTLYSGDLNDINSDEPSVSYAFGGGLGYYFSPSVALGLDYRVGDYPRTLRPVTGDYTKRHTANLYLMFSLLPSKSVNPYLLAGAGMTMWGNYDRDPEFQPVYGPMAGLGLNFRMSERVTFFVEGKMDFILDDEAIDGIDDNGSDMLGFIGGGLRFALRSGFKPVGAISISGPRELLVGKEGEFSVSLVEDATPPVEYTWDLGDGTTKFGSEVLYQYAQPGTYTVSVMVSNARSSEERLLTVRVRARPEPAQIAALRADNTQPDVGQTVRFIADITGTEPVSVSWNFGDGTTSQQKLAQHSYSEPGEYTVTLTVDNTAVAGEGARETRTLRIRVQEPDVEIPALRTVHFALNSSYFDDETRQILRENIRIMQENPGLCVVVKGYTDGTGADRYNQWLSERRAERVKDFYVENGIMAERIHFTGEGLAPEPCPAGATGCRENRRVETELVECE